jgi:hypothetical protein
LSYEDLAKVMNCFDLYTQYANCEGFGLPQVEAAACGVPVCGTDYSAMESVLRKLEGFTITPAALYKELETGCLRAVPDNEYASEIFLHFFEKMNEEDRVAMGKRTRENFEKHYQWHLSGARWEKYFDETDPIEFQQGWGSEPKIIEPAPKPDLKDNVRHKDLARWLIVNVLGDSSKLNTFFESRLTRDLLYRQSTSSTGGMYFNESSQIFDSQGFRNPFDLDIAYQQLRGMCEKRNYWENLRVQRINQIAGNSK